MKDSEKRLTKKFPCYEEYKACEDDPVVKACIEETLLNFDAEPDDITVNIKLEVK